jgi:hypothetical protein
MSSDTLLEEVNETVKDIKKKFLSSKLSESSSVDDLNSLLVKEQVRLGSLRRQQELAMKLASDLPDRIEKIEEESKELEKLNRDLLEQEILRKKRIEEIKNRQNELIENVEKILKLIQQSREYESISLFKKNNLWFLISRVVDLRKSLLTNHSSSMKSLKDEADYDLLSHKIEHNDRLIREIENKLSNL